MTNQVIPAEAVEAAAKAMWDASDPVRKKARPTWESIANDPDWRRAVEYNRKDAKVALEAAAPYIRAQTLNDVLETRVEDCAKAWEKGWDAGMRFQPNKTNPYRTTL